MTSTQSDIKKKTLLLDFVRQFLTQYELLLLIYTEDITASPCLAPYVCPLLLNNIIVHGEY